nr:uncharacterized protein LOC113823105 [Penaeus vannamei]
MKRWGVHHVISSPHYPQSNGHAEAAVKSTKYLIMKTAPSGNIDNEDFDRGLLELRNIPNATGRSPAQIFYGRPLRSCVPAHPESFLEEWQEKSEDCDRRAAAQAEQVRQRDYEIRLPSGRVWWRNQHFLRPVPTPSADPIPHIPVTPCSDMKMKSSISKPPVFPHRSKRLMKKQSARD